MGTGQKRLVELDEKTSKEITVAREQVKRGETISLEKLKKNLGR
jgi:hypothetical protein